MPRVAARFLTVRTWESSISPAPYKHDREGSWTNHKSPREILKNILFWISHGSGLGFMPSVLQVVSSRCSTIAKLQQQSTAS